MTWFDQDSPVKELSEQVFLYNLAQMRGNEALLSRIPKNKGGVYAWYRYFELDQKVEENPDIFVKFILQELDKEQFASRKQDYLQHIGSFFSLIPPLLRSQFCGNYLSIQHSAS